ncbi:MAG: DUF3488 and transglutaminase-like domain-containing protein [Pseudomonadota bacterium]
MNGRVNGGAAGHLLSRLALPLTRDKADTLLLLASALMVLAPHAAHLPLWASATVCATLAWRASITLRGKRMPPLWLLLPVSLLSMAGVYGSFHTLLGRDAGVAMLALLLAFKLLEMHARRDLFVVIFLSFFLLLTSFFYSQSMLTALFMALTIVLLLATLMTFQYTNDVPPLAQRLRAAAHIVVIAAPLALLLFIAFPRLQGPLWGLPGDANGARSGMSESMSPGSMSSLALSEDIVLRARFTQQAPAQSQLYWRGIVLSQYDGQTWTRGARAAYRRGEAPDDVTIQLRGQALQHEVTLEPTGKRWLFLLELTAPGLRVANQRVIHSDELEASTQEAMHARVRYEANAYPDHQVQADADEKRMAPWLRLPAGYNPRSVALAITLRRPGDAAGSVQAVLTMFRQQAFSYTLEPPLLGHDAVDEFLFTTRAGFCEHYAGAFVVLMRAMGIPARVVTGYQGGELNPVDGYLTVRQSDAHAWAEVWLTGRGWLRVDPTGAVAPERVEHNLARALPQRAPFGIAGLGDFINFRNDRDSWLAQLRFGANAMNNAWNQWVLDYNPDRQRSFLAELGFAFGNWRAIAALLGIVALLGAARLVRARTRQDPADAAYAAFCRTMARRGFARAPHEGPCSYAVRLQAMASTPRQQAAMRDFLALYGALKYAAPTEQRHAAVKRLFTLLTQLR